MQLGISTQYIAVHIICIVAIKIYCCIIYYIYIHIEINIDLEIVWLLSSYDVRKQHLALWTLQATKVRLHLEDEEGTSAHDGQSDGHGW